MESFVVTVRKLSPWRSTSRATAATQPHRLAVQKSNPAFSDPTRLATPNWSYLTILFDFDAPKTLPVSSTDVAQVYTFDVTSLLHHASHESTLQDTEQTQTTASFDKAGFPTRPLPEQHRLIYWVALLQIRNRFLKDLTQAVNSARRGLGPYFLSLSAHSLSRLRSWLTDPH